ncbi:sugar isomerase (sis) [Lucifera butyrica]|uniref:Sugar isomerase (Sis) n=1 Tax=Lucifera butyrica TaxID=1351585 RepID=A0A498RBE4_9FIRM|nr:MurR/RpiR family transcriptional regulator [Lucifera butyrica]VBB08814.1 sugar isomerase (sis) [Lucifera butyrica]
MEADSVLLRVEQYANRCTKSETGILNEILRNPQEVAKDTIVEFAAKCEVSEPTITRFVRKIGFKHYTEFRIILSQELLRDEIKKNQNYDEKKEISGLYEEYCRLLEKSSALISQEILNELIDMMDQATRIKIYGIGASGLTAFETATKLLRVGYSVFAVSDASYMRRDASYSRQGDLIIAFSVSGETRDLVAALELAAKHGARIILVSAYEHSAASKFAHKVVFTSRKDSLPAGHFISSEIAQLFVVDCLYERIVRRNPDKLVDYEAKAFSAVVDDFSEARIVRPRKKKE